MAPADLHDITQTKVFSRSRLNRDAIVRSPIGSILVLERPLAWSQNSATCLSYLMFRADDPCQHLHRISKEPYVVSEQHSNPIDPKTRE